MSAQRISAKAANPYRSIITEPPFGCVIAAADGSVLDGRSNILTLEQVFLDGSQ
jgi:predicted RNA methylase